MSISSYDDKDKIFINSDNDVTCEYLVYWRGSMIGKSPREFMKEINQYRYKAEWLALEINRSMNIAVVDIDW
ncbi:21102_t:CDS:1, partial [Rhizophagus irregularis]